MSRPGVQGAGARRRRRATAEPRRPAAPGASTGCSSSATRPTTSPTRRRASPRAPSARAATPLDLAYDLLLARRRPRASSTCRSSTTPTATSTPPARCSPTRTRSSASATAARTSARSATPASRPRCSRSGAATATAAGSTLPFLVQRQTQRDRAHGRPARPRRARARLPRRRQRDRLRAPHRAPARDAPRPARRRQAPRAGAPTATSPRVVAGEVTYEHGEPTGPLPGRLVRGPQPAPTERSSAMTTDRRRRPRAARDRLRVAARRARRRLRRSSSPTRTSPSSTPRCVHAEAHTDDVLDITRESFPLPDARARARRAHARARSTARGVVLIRGVPVDRYGKERASTIYWGVGTHLGQPWPQNAKGHLLGDVTDQGRAVDDPTSRGNEIGGFAFPFHSDGSDLVGLFCLDAGASGGASLVANAVDDPQRARAHRARARGRALRAVPVRLPRRAGARARRPGTRCRSSTGCGDRLFVRYIRPVHRVVAPPRRRAPAVGRGARGDGPRSTRCAPTRSTTCR